MVRETGLGWDLESLTKVYRQGYTAGLMGMGRNSCSYRGEVVLAAWEAGWEDGLTTQAAGTQSADQPQLQSRIA